jgi:putative DNA primase/helicase
VFTIYLSGSPSSSPRVEAIGLNGVWGSAIKHSAGWYVVRAIPQILREQLVRPLAKNLGVPIDELRKLTPTKAQADFDDPDPWPDTVNGAALLDELKALVEKHAVIEDHCKVATPLWTVLTYLVDAVDILPLLGIFSPEKRCGKSRLLAFLSKVVRRPMPGVYLTPATVFRAIEKWHPTLLIDEADRLLKDSKGNDNVELRSVINAGHTREFARVPRCVGENNDVQHFSTWAPKALALIGRMPDSMMDRSIPIQMRRKATSETVARLRETPQAVFDELRSKIVRFVQDNADKIAQRVPTLPAGINDRAADCWLPMLAIADIAGGDWPDLARKAAVALSADSDEADTFTTKLLRSLKQDFIDEAEDHIGWWEFTNDICAHLNQANEAPWANYKNQLTPELLAKTLRRYKLKSQQETINGRRGRGFYWENLQPVFDRYL